MEELDDDEKKVDKYKEQRKEDNKKQQDKIDYRRKKKLTKKILFVLGKLGGYNQSILNERNDNINTNISQNEQIGRGLKVDADIISWDTQKRIRYVWSFPDTKLTVYLDDLLPQICYLAQNSTDRATKVASCEALHSIIVH